jgi:hypothetical protein
MRSFLTKYQWYQIVSNYFGMKPIHFIVFCFNSYIFSYKSMELLLNYSNVNNVDLKN